MGGKSQASGCVCVQVFDVETGFDRTLLNMNPGGWIPGVSNERTWVMLYGMDVDVERQVIIAGDSKGKVYFVDARTDAEVAQCQLHKKGNKAGPPNFYVTACLYAMMECTAVQLGHAHALKKLCACTVEQSTPPYSLSCIVFSACRTLLLELSWP